MKANIMTITKDTPITFLTVGQLQQALGLEEDQAADRSTEQNEKSRHELKRYVYGLRGIRELFGVSHVTAQKYKDTFLQEAVSQQGKVIITDAEKALELFKNHKERK